jgi:hypothetical protein
VCVLDVLKRVSELHRAELREGCHSSAGGRLERNIRMHGYIRNTYRNLVGKFDRKLSVGISRLQFKDDIAMYHKGIWCEILIWRRTSDVSCGHINKLWPSIKGRKYRDKLNHYQLLQKNFAPRSYSHFILGLQQYCFKIFGKSIIHIISFLS